MGKCYEANKVKRHLVSSVFESFLTLQDVGSAPRFTCGFPISFACTALQLRYQTC